MKTRSSTIKYHISIIVPRIRIHGLIRNNCNGGHAPVETLQTHKTRLRDNFIETRAHEDDSPLLIYSSRALLFAGVAQLSAGKSNASRCQHSRDRDSRMKSREYTLFRVVTANLSVGNRYTYIHTCIHKYIYTYRCNERQPERSVFYSWCILFLISRPCPADIGLSIRETAKHQPDRAVCGRVALTNRAYSLFPCASCHRETAVKVSIKKKKKTLSRIRFRCTGDTWMYRTGQYSRSQKCGRLKEIYSIEKIKLRKILFIRDTMLL